MEAREECGPDACADGGIGASAADDGSREEVVVGDVVDDEETDGDKGLHRSCTSRANSGQLL